MFMHVYHQGKTIVFFLKTMHFTMLTDFPFISYWKLPLMKMNFLTPHKLIATFAAPRIFNIDKRLLDLLTHSTEHFPKVIYLSDL